jgi:hypothetical protein
MSAARPRLVDADFEEIGDERRADRRRSDRRAPRMRLEPAFAATLINQLSPAKQDHNAGYSLEPKRLRAGVAFDLRA